MSASEVGNNLNSVAITQSHQFFKASRQCTVLAAARLDVLKQNMEIIVTLLHKQHKQSHRGHRIDKYTHI